MKVVVLLSKTFFPQHPKARQLTYFCEKVTGFQGNALKKIHTCRCNYEYWKKKIDKLKAEGGVLSVRQWSENPYRSPQETIIDIPAEIVGVQKLCMKYDFSEAWLYENYNRYLKVCIYDLALNDGLSVDDFKAWFAPVFKKEQKEVLDFAIIHFTKFRY